MNDSIDKVWFGEGRIWILTTEDETKSQPLEIFPTLFYASDNLREAYYLWDNNRSIRWDALDEDIHITSFFEDATVNYNNEVNGILSKFPYLDIKVLAEYLNMHWTRLARLKFGVIPASKDTIKKIKDTIIALGKEMSAASF